MTRATQGISPLMSTYDTPERAHAPTSASEWCTNGPAVERTTRGRRSPQIREAALPSLEQPLITSVGGVPIPLFTPLAESHAVATRSSLAASRPAMAQRSPEGACRRRYWHTSWPVKPVAP
eukprot:scaffold108082_cov26-Tisochrysis_lutea.AAC.1